tara:strand:- start:409 stop:633 length:225 start_codon:yes stop_codon:yes gene_type:complete
MVKKKAPDGNRTNEDGTVQTLKYYPKPGDGPTFLPGKPGKIKSGRKNPSKEQIKEMLKDRKLMPKKSGAGYSGD